MFRYLLTDYLSCSWYLRKILIHKCMMYTCDAASLKHTKHLKKYFSRGMDGKRLILANITTNYIINLMLTIDFT